MNLRFFLLSIFLLTKVTIKAQTNIAVKIDDRMEALSIFFTLATADTLNTKPTPSVYYGDVKHYFQQFKNHPSLNWYRKLDEWDGFDLSSLGLFLSESYPFKLKVKPKNNYLTSSSPIIFLAKFNQFYKDAKVNAFLKDHRKQYDLLSKQMQDTLKKMDVLSAINSFYGQTPKQTFILYLDLLNNLGSNAIPSNHPSFQANGMFRMAYHSQKENYLTDDSAVVFKNYSNVVIHEINHLRLANFLATYHHELAEIKGHFLTTAKGETLKESAWENEMEELIVRAFTAKIIAQKFGEDRGSKDINNQAKHFKWSIPLYNFLDKYLTDRDKYKTIVDFYPELILFLKTGTS